MIMMIPLDVCASLRSIRELISIYFESMTEVNKKSAKGAK